MNHLISGGGGPGIFLCAKFGIFSFFKRLIYFKSKLKQGFVESKKHESKQQSDLKNFFFHVLQKFCQMKKNFFYFIRCYEILTNIALLYLCTCSIRVLIIVLVVGPNILLNIVLIMTL